MRIGMVCPYSLDVAGGVQAHVIGLAAALRARGHTVQVLAPAQGPVPEFVTPAGRSVGVPYNGSVARVAFGPVAYGRVRRFIAAHPIDVLHLHEPTTASISAIALLLSDGPVVATFHASTERSRALSALGGVIQPLMEKVTARIAVSPSARRLQVRHLGGDAIEIPNGIDVAAFSPRGPRAPETVAFVGRFDEPRKGMAVLLGALRLLAPRRPDVRLVVVGQGDAAALRHAAGPVRLEALGAVDDDAKAAVLASATVFCAPHTGGESFGIVLTEAMAAGAPVLASDLDAFRAVLGDPPAGELFAAGDPAALAGALGALLDDPTRRVALSVAGRVRAADFDWSRVAADVERVYRAAVAADPRQRAS
ncbi:MAG: glycosyltransferase family 4 protein [Pseudonocardiales bacterium]|nr:glycosyltransferase family 4 protein [Pseudonocardiales bacterium]